MQIKTFAVTGLFLSASVLGWCRAPSSPSPSPGALETPPVIFPVPLSPRNANYAIKVSLDPTTHTLKGEENILWRNITRDTVGDAWFHLYLNAFANNRTIFMKESSGRLRNLSFKKKGWGYCLVKSVEILGKDGKVHALRQLFPGEDRTVMKVELPVPVPPGGEARFRVFFEDRLPKIFARAGYAGDFVMAGQWFPKLGVYQEGKGWNCHGYHMNSEFFSDFGVYNVSITVPKNYVVGATGTLWREIDGKTTKRLDFHAEDVHDFAWSASPRFLDIHAQWKGVVIRVLMQPDDRNQAKRYVASVKKALSLFAKWLWKYPYPQITVVDVPRNGMGAGGMEYPTLITAMTSPRMPKSILFPEMVVVHEFGHQYWYGMSANNEFEEAWLDEGINSYYESKIMDEWFGPHRSLLNGFIGLHAGDGEMQRVAYARLPDVDPMVLDAWRYESNRSYSAISYDKSVVVLRTLEGLLGKKKMGEAMRAFFMKVKFTHPTTEDFIKTFTTVAGPKIEPLLRSMLYGTGTVDFKVLWVKNKEVLPERGFDLAKSSPGTFPSKGKERDRKKLYDSSVCIVRDGSLVLPVDIRVTLADGKVRNEHWDGNGRRRIFRHRGAKVTEVVVDPSRKVPLDLCRANNGWLAKTEPAPTRALTTRIRIVEQTLFQLLSTVL